MATVYLDTSFVSACVSTRVDAKSVYRRETSLEWMGVQATRHQIYVSAEVLAELNSPSFPSRDAALGVVASIPVLEVTGDARRIAAAFIAEKVMPGPIGGDSLHVAVCCFNGVEYLLSWNVRHLANPNKAAHLQTICARLGLSAPRIVTP